MSQQEAGTYCRICGSSKLNKFYYALDLSSKVGFYQILRRDGSLDQLIRPCECRGDFAFAHRVCLANWIETTKHEYCDVCRFKYNITLVERSIFDWIFETQQLERILKVICTISVVYYLTSLGILMYLNRGLKNVLDVGVFSTSCVWIFASTLALVFYVYQFLKEFKCWKHLNKLVIVDENKNPKLDSQPRPKDVLKSSGFRPFKD